MNEHLGFDNGDAFYKALSDFWTVVYRDKALYRRFTSAYGELFSDAYFRFLESILGVSVKEIPVFDKKKWFFLTFRESENFAVAPLTYQEEGVVYGPQPEGALFTPGKVFKYGGSFSSDELFRWQLPEKMVTVDKFLMNRIHSPSLVMSKGVEFVIDDDQRTITFSSDPFNDPRIPVRTIRDRSGNFVDREVGFWALNSFWDYDYVWKNFGNMIGFFQPSSEDYKTFVNAIWQLFIGGPSFKNIEAGVNAVLGVPISRDVETIQEIFEDAGNNIIITNLNNYSIPSAIPLRRDFFSVDGLLLPEINLEPFEPLTSVITMKDSVSDPGWWREVEPLIIPRNLIREDVDFLIPSGVLLYADTQVGSMWSLPQEFDAPNEEIRTIGLRIGEFVIGEESPGVPSSTQVDYKDYIMNTYFKDNLFFLSISPTATLLPNFKKQVVTILNDAIPAYTTFLNYTFLDALTEVYTAEDTDNVMYVATSSTGFDGVERIEGHNSGSEVIDIGIGVPLSEVAEPVGMVGYDPATTLGYEEGYHGMPFIGSILIGGFTIGTFGFNNGLLVRSTCGS